MTGAERVRFNTANPGPSLQWIVLLRLIGTMQFLLGWGWTRRLPLFIHLFG